MLLETGNKNQRLTKQTRNLLVYLSKGKLNTDNMPESSETLPKLPFPWITTSKSPQKERLLLVRFKPYLGLKTNAAHQ